MYALFYQGAMAWIWWKREIHFWSWKCKFKTVSCSYYGL